MIFGITLTSVMGVTSIAPAFPSISRALGVSTGQIGLLITFFTIPGILFTPILGILADRLGRKVILIPSLILFGLAGTACAFANSFGQLLLLRAVQGIGSAALGVLNLTLIGDLYTGNRRAQAMGYNGSVLSVGTALYPAIGGALAIIEWYYPFFIALLALPVGLGAAVLLKAKPLENGMKLNLYFREVTSLLKSKLVIGLFTGIFLTCMMLYGGYITFFTVLLDEKFSKNALAIGIILSSSSLVTALTASRLGWLTQRFSEESLILTSSILYLLLFLFIPQVTNIWFFAIPIVLFGIAQGINLPSALNLLTGYAPRELRAAFLSMNWMVMKAGQALGPYLLGLIYLAYHLEGTFYVTAMIAAAFVLVNLFLVQNRRKRKLRETDPG